MADALTKMSSLSVDQTAYDRFLYHSLRKILHYDGVADVKPTNQSMPGSAVVFTILTDMAIASTALNESVDVDAVALADSQVTVTLVEYGNVAKTTAKLRGTSFVALDPEVAGVIAWNAGESVDRVARGQLEIGTNVRYATGGATDPNARNKVEPGDILTAVDVRRALADLKGANVATFGNGFYKAFIHPDVSFDLRGETGAAAWRDPHTYSEPGAIWNGSIGAFEGFEFVESNNSPVFADAGSSTTLTDVYRTMFLGRQALAKAHSVTDGNGAMPKTVVTPVQDDLRRFTGFGWYWLGGYKVFRQASLRAVEGASSIGTNA